MECVLLAQHGIQWLALWTWNFLRKCHIHKEDPEVSWGQLVDRVLKEQFCSIGTLKSTFGRLFMPGWRLLCCCSSDGRRCVRGWAGCGTCALGGSSALSPMSPHLQQQQQPAQTHENRAFGEAARATASRALPIQVLPHVPAATASTSVVCSFGDTAIMRTIYVNIGFLSTRRMAPENAVAWNCRNSAYFTYCISVFQQVVRGCYGRAPVHKFHVLHHCPSQYFGM